MAQQWQWVYTGGSKPRKVPHGEKAAITTACERLIADVLLPRYLPRIEPTPYNYPVGIRGSWHANKYRFQTEYRCGAPDSMIEGFEHPFARIDWVSKDRYDLSWMRHNDKWVRMYGPITLDEALSAMANESFFQPC